MKGLVVSMASHAHAPRDAAAPPMPAATLVAKQLELILASRHLDGSDRLKRFLRLVVEETLAGRGSTLKEYTIGVQVYDRGEAFDPKGDSIVRGEANRLRGRIADYYADPATQNEVRIDLPKGSYVPTFGQPPGPATTAAAPRRWSSWAALLMVLGAAVTGGILVGLGMRAPGPSAPVRIVRAELGVAPAADLNGGGNGNVARLWTRGGSHTALAWTPDGRRLVYVGRRDGVQQLYVRDLDRAEARPLGGTDEAQEPAVSPDGQSVVFWSSGELKRVPLDGGPVQTIVRGVDAPPAGVAVGVTGRVAFGYYEIRQRSTGSTWTAMTSRAAGEASHGMPQLLANDSVVLFTVKPTPFTWSDARVVAQVLATGERKLLLRDAVDARFVPPGYLVFLRRGLLMAVPFDLARLEVTGEPVAVLDGVSQALTGDGIGDVTGAGQFSVSSTGALAYVANPVVPYPHTALATIDRQGRVADLAIEARSYVPHLRVSPDGRRLAVLVSSLTEVALCVLDLSRGSLTKLSAGGEAHFPLWTPDGQRIAFEWNHDGASRVVWQRADASAPPQTLVASDVRPQSDVRLTSWSPRGEHLAATKDADLWIVTPGERPPTLARLAATPDDEELSPEFSPDGKWLAYVADKTGRWEVYLRPYPGPGASALVSLNGGMNPAWNPRGNGELFFLEPQPDSSVHHRMMTVNITSGRAGTPRVLFERRDASLLGLLSCGRTRCYDVAPDGQRFFVTRQLPTVPPPPVTHVDVVLNWVEELKAKVPSRR